MKTVKQQFENFRSETPKHLQWLLLIAAFVIVIIVLTLVIGNKHKKTDKIIEPDKNVEIRVVPETLDFFEVTVGNSETRHIDVMSNTPVVFDDVTINAPEFLFNDTCEGLTDSCFINVTYNPDHPRDTSVAVLTIKWHPSYQEDLKNTKDINISFSAKEAPAPVLQPEPVFEPEQIPVFEPEQIPVFEPEQIPVFEPEQIPVFEPEPKYDDKEDFSYQPAPIDQIQPVVPAEPFQQTEPEMPVEMPSAKCSDFAIPGYDQSGTLFGWIKPEGGANYFYPLSDKDCTNPTGKYDFTSGLITSLKDGSRIGTDADHIGYKRLRTRTLSVPSLMEPRGVNNSITGGNTAVARNGKFEGATPQWAPVGKDGREIMKMDGSKSTMKRFSATDWKDLATGDDVKLKGSAAPAESVLSSVPYDRTFILRQFKPIPATIVSEVRADPSVYGYNRSGGGDGKQNYSIPVRATVDRNVFSDDGRTIIIPTGTLLLGYLDGKLPGPYQTFGRMNIKWYQFIRPDGVEFNFGSEEQDPYSADAQGRVGVPGHGSTDYLEQMVMPILTSLVPAAVNMIAPISDTIINQIDLDNNTIVQSGTIRSSEMAKQDIINTWNKVAQKLLVDTIDNTVPPFSIAAGTRINVYSPVDLIVACPEEKGKKCAFITEEFAKNQRQSRRKWSDIKGKVKVDASDGSWIGQVRSFNFTQYCKEDPNTHRITINETEWQKSGQDYRTIYAFCESQNYEAKNNAKQTAYNQNQQQQFQDTYGTTSTYNSKTGAYNLTFADDASQQKYNEEVLGLQYNSDGTMVNPFSGSPEPVVTPGQEVEIITCQDGSNPDANGCCSGETYTNMGESYVDEDGSHFACCPAVGEDCFPPIKMN